MDKRKKFCHTRVTINNYNITFIFLNKKEGKIMNVYTTIFEKTDMCVPEFAYHIMYICMKTLHVIHKSVYFNVSVKHNFFKNEWNGKK